MAAIERCVPLGIVQALVRPAALAAGERAAGDQTNEGVGVLEQLAQPLTRANDARVAPQRAARRRARHGGRGQRAQGIQCRLLAEAAAGARSPSAWATARRANTKHSESELEASRLAPCRPVQEVSPTA